MEEAIPPALRYRITDVVRLLPTEGRALEGQALDRLERLVEDGDGWLGADPGLAEVGFAMIDARNSVELRRQGCAWLARFPSVDTATKLAAIARDAATPAPVREQAIWTLGYRQVRGMHPSTLWPADAIAIADEALARLADEATTDGAIASEKLPLAARHVNADLMMAVFAKAPGLWGDALECYASAPLARVLFVSLDEIPPQHRLRAIRLIGATLGEEAVPLFVGRAAQVGLDERLELLLLAVGLGGEGYLPKLEDALAGMAFIDLYRQRAKWHLRNRWVVPTVRGLKIARATATLPIATRAEKCAQAADDLGALAKFARHPEAYLYTMWGWMVRGSKDASRARQLVEAHPESQRLVRDLYLEDLARRGRVKQLAAAAQELAGADLGALWLAICGRPLAALELAATARLHTPELVCARALACFRAGRADLTHRILDEDLPPSEIVAEGELAKFPGPHEQWMIEHAPGARPAIAALAGGRNAVIALARPAPDDAEPDTASLVAVEAVVRRLGRGLPGSTVYLAGEFKRLDKAAIGKAVEAAGARLVGGPFPGTDYYVHGDWCYVQTIAQLERQGARRLRSGELPGAEI